jgi:ElaB/YqjD/DUF883 family membrane-anchored ribosome-binding protein
MAEAKAKETKVEKTVTPREDPIARAARLLQETIDKQKAKAENELDKAREDLAKSEDNVAKATRVRDARKARVERLESLALGNPAHSYAAALGQTEITDGDVDVTEGQVDEEG